MKGKEDKTEKASPLKMNFQTKKNSLETSVSPQRFHFGLLLLGWAFQQVSRSVIGMLDTLAKQGLNITDDFNVPISFGNFWG